MLLFVVLCLGTMGLLAVVDQPSLLGTAYVQAAAAGNAGIVDLIGDRFTEDQSFNRRMFALDFQRDSQYLQGAELSDLRAERTQTLSGQWVTVMHFKYREAGSGANWTDGALRIKTDGWLLLTYVRAVEKVEP